ncbi:MAG: cytochrome c3 family protein [Desulfuromonadales bacterium]|nr:cytochrome c3 family protein [Desulfuromonadales bacterium]
MRQLLCLLVITLLVASGVALAVPSGKTLEYVKGSLGMVKFDGTVHKQAGLKCNECHTEGVFPKMKQGTVAISMDEIYAGKQCGVCHNGQRAFEAKGNCERCHIKP